MIQENNELFGKLKEISDIGYFDYDTYRNVQNYTLIETIMFNKKR